MQRVNTAKYHAHINYTVYTISETTVNILLATSGCVCLYIMYNNAYHRMF